MHILITGGAGFIGSKIAQQLIDRGDEVSLIDNFNDYYDPSLKRDRISELLRGKDHILYEGDIRDENFLEKIFSTKSIDKVVHLAAMAGVRSSIEKPLLYEEVNVRGTMLLLEMVKKYPVKHFVYASSSSVYGNNKKIPFSEDDSVDHPISPYAATKKATELLAHTYKYLYNIPLFVQVQRIFLLQNQHILLHFLHTAPFHSFHCFSLSFFF
ncbi:MAG: NAD-dependent epimerase/dehydratase family protein, partial [Candidatus Moranbacteria bacterium]|nr:NAD-dependent epimerase/dehydratase family protein [Candidatus Moranbacteria bacterium]